MRVAITGSSGLVGRALVAALEGRGDEVFGVERSDPGAGGLFWTRSGEARLEPADGGGLDAVVHLAGAPIAAKRWSESYKREIRESRVEGTRALVAAMGAMASPPRTLVSASAVAIYGPGAGPKSSAGLVPSPSEQDLGGSGRGPGRWTRATHGDDEPLPEARVPEAGLAGDTGDFLTDVARGWEREAFAARALGVERVVTLRNGIVLDPAGGALERMLPPFRFGLGARLARGTQWMSWITLADLVRVILFTLDDERVDGPLNTVTPEPVTNDDFTKTLARALGRPLLPGMFVPRFALRLLVGEFADAALLESHRATPAVLESLGFECRTPGLAAGLADVLG
ncbi:MAG: DUF1731 domain-containing protein [Planctomycetota bacterium]|nr:DUF1731 domain-containing protein [Planctomycetota bacterium]